MRRFVVIELTETDGEPSVGCEGTALEVLNYIDRYPDRVGADPIIVEGRVINIETLEISSENP